jgi:hypothetical protein
MSAEERTLAAEVRAVERGSHARLAGDGTTMLVASESEPGVNRHVRVQAVGMVVTFTCSCPYGNNQPKTIPCVHSSCAARRLEREGLLRWESGRWVPGYKTPLTVVPDEPEDPFLGLPT